MKMRPLPFRPTVSEISIEEAGSIRGLEAVISYWTEENCTAGEWFREVLSFWGSAGLAMRRGEEVLGFAVYGPQQCLPRAGRYPLRPLGEDAPLLAYLKGDGRTRRYLLVRAMRNLKLRGFGGVEAITSDLGLPWHVPTQLLLGSGWKPVRRGLSAGCPYTLMRADFGSTVEVGELARELVGRVKLPVLKAPAPGTPASAQVSALAPAGGSLAGGRTQE